MSACISRPMPAIQGCDASVLISGASSERSAPHNFCLRGFEVIDDAKSQLEAACPGVVSCADILALAAHDAVDLTGGPSWSVPLGRRDGRISSASDAKALPSPADPVSVQRQKFADQGLTDHDLVTLVDGLPLLPVPPVQLHGDGQRGPDDQRGVPAAAAGAVPAQRRPLATGGAGQGQRGRVRRELLQERQGRRGRAGVGPEAVGRRRDAGRRAELRRQHPRPVRAQVQLRVPQGHGEDEQHQGED